MQKEDIEGVCEIERLSFNIPWSKEAFIYENCNSNTVYVVAKFDNKVVGYIGFYNICGEAHINNIAVLPNYRGNGIGDKLLQFLIQYCEKNDILAATLEVRVSNVIAQRLYKKHGFNVEGIRKGYYGDTNEDALIMWRRGIKSGEGRIKKNNLCLRILKGSLR